MLTGTGKWRSEREASRQTDRQTDRDGRTDGQTETHTDRHDFLTVEQNRGSAWESARE